MKKLLVVALAAIAACVAVVPAQAVKAPKPPRFTHGTLHGVPAHATWVALGPDCELHAYLPKGNNTWVAGDGSISCNQNERQLQIEACYQVWTGSSWATKSGLCLVSPVAYGASGLGDAQNPVFSYDGVPSCAPNSHEYRSEMWGYDLDNAGHAHQIWYASSGTIVC